MTIYEFPSVKLLILLPIAYKKEKKNIKYDIGLQIISHSNKALSMDKHHTLNNSIFWAPGTRSNLSISRNDRCIGILV